MSAQLTMKNRVNKEKRCSLDKCLSLWYNLSIEIENIFSVLFIAFDETLLTQLPRLSPPQNRVNSNERLPRKLKGDNITITRRRIVECCYVRNFCIWEDRSIES